MIFMKLDFLTLKLNYSIKLQNMFLIDSVVIFIRSICQKARKYYYIPL